MPRRVPLYWLWHEQQTDSAYTQSEERREFLVRERGYRSMGIIAYVDTRKSPRSKSLKCFYAAEPRTNTFCSISETEQRFIVAIGYQMVSDEGFILNEREPGTVVLYRVSKAYGERGADREHRFVTSSEELVRLRSLGWTYDGSKGFVHLSP